MHRPARGPCERAMLTKTIRHGLKCIWRGHRSRYGFDVRAARSHCPVRRNRARRCQRHGVLIRRFALSEGRRTRVDLDLLGDIACVIHINSEFAPGVFDLRMGKQYLDCPRIAGSPSKRNCFRDGTSAASRRGDRCLFPLFGAADLTFLFTRPVSLSAAICASTHA